MSLEPTVVSSFPRLSDGWQGIFGQNASLGVEEALQALGEGLRQNGYRFTTVTPLSHRRVSARQKMSRPTLEDVFGWSRPFHPGDLSDALLRQLQAAGAIETNGAQLRSAVRFSTLGNQLFVHSGFPTEAADAVFFGPDTYRFARLVTQSIQAMGRLPQRILDVGAGSGAGGICAATAAGGHVSICLTDINSRALRFCRINAALNGIPSATVIKSDLLAQVEGSFDLIVSNPPYLVDPRKRFYRHGGGELGAGLSLEIVKQAVPRLAPGGRLVLYTGSAIVAGIDRFYDDLKFSLHGTDVTFRYEEIDPDVFGEELECAPYDQADRIAVIAVTVDAPRQQKRSS